MVDTLGACLTHDRVDKGWLAIVEFDGSLGLRASDYFEL